MKVCNHPGCPKLSPGPYCGDHAGPARRRHPKWARVRRAWLAAHPRCEACGAPASEVDHITALADGGAELDPANLQALCRSCHRAKTAADAV